MTDFQSGMREVIQEVYGAGVRAGKSKSKASGLGMVVGGEIVADEALTSLTELIEKRIIKSDEERCRDPYSQFTQHAIETRNSFRDEQRKNLKGDKRNG